MSTVSDGRQLCGFNYPSGHRGGLVILQDYPMNAYNEHRNKKQNIKQVRLNWLRPHRCTVTAGDGLLNN